MIWQVNFITSAGQQRASKSAEQRQVCRRTALALLGGEGRYYEATAPSGSPRMPGRLYLPASGIEGADR